MIEMGLATPELVRRMYTSCLDRGRRLIVKDQ